MLVGVSEKLSFVFQWLDKLGDFWNLSLNYFIVPHQFVISCIISYSRLYAKKVFKCYVTSCPGRA